VRIARFARSGDISFGLVQGAGDDPAALQLAPLTGHPLFDPTPTGEVVPLSSVRLLAPTQPINVVCIGKNYADHVREMGGAPAGPGPGDGDPVVFLKPATSVVGPGDPVRLPAGVGRVDHEGELAVVLGKPARDLTRANALEHVWGYTPPTTSPPASSSSATASGPAARATTRSAPRALARDRPRPRRPAGALRGRRGAAPGRPHPRPAARRAVGAGVHHLLHDAAARGRVLTGTPAGVGPLEPGVTVSVEVEGIGTLTNPVVAR
jgi:hypothetical protein